MSTAKEILEKKERERQTQPSWIVSQMKVGECKLIDCEDNEAAKRIAGTFHKAATRQNRAVETTTDGNNLVVVRIRKVRK